MDRSDSCEGGLIGALGSHHREIGKLISEADKAERILDTLNSTKNYISLLEEQVKVKRKMVEKYIDWIGEAFPNRH